MAARDPSQLPSLQCTCVAAGGYFLRGLECSQVRKAAPSPDHKSPRPAERRQMWRFGLLGMSSAASPKKAADVSAAEMIHMGADC